MTDPTQHRPIGYWLKRADELLTRRIDEAQRSNGLTRLDWQALNTMHEAGTMHRDELADALRPFADPGAVDAAVQRLAERHLVRRTDSTLALTPEGIELHEKALGAQLALRQQAVAGISDAEYRAVVDVLRRLVANLERGE